MNPEHGMCQSDAGMVPAWCRTPAVLVVSTSDTDCLKMTCYVSSVTHNTVSYQYPFCDIIHIFIHQLVVTKRAKYTHALPFVYELKVCGGLHI